MQNGCPVHIGRYTYDHRLLNILAWQNGASLRIGQFCSLANDIQIILGGEHMMGWVTTSPLHMIFDTPLPSDPVASSRRDIEIGNDVWIATGATILGGVTIGNGAVVAAHSVVTRDVPPYSVVAGNPARVRKLRFEQEIIVLLQNLRWWDLPTAVIQDLTPKLLTDPDAQTLRDWIKTYAPIR